MIKNINKLMVAIDSWEKSTRIWKKWANFKIFNQEKKTKKYLNSSSAKCTIYCTIPVNGIRLYSNFEKKNFKNKPVRGVAYIYI